MKPEEIIRQNLLLKMCSQYGFRRELIGVEKEISTLPHLKGMKVPKRRIDLVCFSGRIDKQLPLYPLLLIECKAISLSSHALEQVLGYNYYVGAYFVAIANADGLLIWDKNGEMIQNGLMQYEELERYAMDRREKSLSGF